MAFSNTFLMQKLYSTDDSKEQRHLTHRSISSLTYRLQSAARMSDMRNYCVLHKDVSPNYYNHLYLDDSRLTYLCKKQ